MSIEDEDMAASARSGTVTDKRGISRVGYVIAVVLNLVLLYVVNNLLAWGWVPFLTDDFEQLLPIIGLSFVIGAVTNAAFVFYNARWFKSVGQIVQSVVSLLVIVATWKVFPFDFSPYSIDWVTIARVVMILSGVAVAIGLIAEVVKMIRALVADAYSSSDPNPNAG